MAKDPAVLLYTQDFLVGTMTMNYEQKGKYIHLLCLQHQKVKLTLKDLKTVLTEEDVDVFEKFPLNSDGFYYNIRMYEEAIKRKNYSESRRNNRSKKTSDLDVNNLSKRYDETYDTTYVPHMENENENENEDVNDIVNETEIKNVNVNVNEDVIVNQYKQAILKKDSTELLKHFDNIFSDV
jgi:alkylated DNA repair dioxygenase AlkB